ncbi:MAG: OstA-like protein, partial [Saprospiraceae bacterium]
MVLFNSLLSGQASKDTSDYINFEEAKFGTILTKDKISIFSGEVAFSHKGVHFYADTVYRSDNIIRAKGNILIQQGDSLSIFADSLFYNSVTRQCELYSNVSLIKNDQKLYTEKLSYNTNTKIAAFDNNGTFTNGAT